LNQNNIYTLLEFSKRATVFGIRRKMRSYVDNGLVSIAMIDAERCDFRDVLLTLGFLNYGLEQLALADTSPVQDAINLSSGKTKSLIETFFQRDKESVSIEKMVGCTAIETSKGISFIGTGYKKYNPSHDLVKILLEYSDLVHGDKYKKGEITVADEIPLNWLSAEQNGSIKKALLAAKGTASLHTSLKGELSLQSPMQMLLIYLSEFEGDEYPKLILEHLKKVPPANFKRVAFVQDHILCLIIQNAVMAGSVEFESQASLTRFENPLRQIIERIC
jgi:hypothetical protein